MQITNIVDCTIIGVDNKVHETEHRINHAVYNLPSIIDGDIQDFIDSIKY